MATHRLQVIRRRPRLRSLGTTFPDLDRRTQVVLVLQLVWFTGAMSAVLYLSAGWIAGTAWLALSAAMTLMDAVNWADQHAKDQELKTHEAMIMSRLASQPGGAPLVMDAHTHCGCSFRFAYDEVKEEWQQVTVVTLNASCPLVDAHDLRRAYP